MGYSGGGGSGGGGGGSYGGDGGGGFSSASPPTAGAFRFNTDSSQLEIYDGNQWTGVLATSPEQQTGGTIAIFSGGYTSGPNVLDTQNYVNVSTTGNALDFGDFVGSDRSAIATCGSRTKGLLMGGYPGPSAHGTNEIDANIFSSTGSAFDFGDLSESVRYAVGGGNQIRGIRAGGYDGSLQKTIDYVTISTEGQTAKDFGELSSVKFVFMNGACNQVRTIFPSGGTPGYTNVIEYVMTATLGNAADFGDQTSARRYGQGITCSATRGIFFGGDAPGGNVNTIDYITISTLGNAQDFGDMTYESNGMASSCSPTRGLVAGGWPPAPNGRNDISYIQIPTTGNTADFGDLTYNQSYGTGISNGHGGL